MPPLIHMSEAAALALHAGAYLAAQPDRLVPLAELADACHASLDHMTKVCQRLTRAKVVVSKRGHGGGLRLADPGGELHLSRLYELFEAPLDGPSCLLKHSVCHNRHPAKCVFCRDLSSIQAQIADYLRSTTLASVAARSKAGQGKGAAAR